ncbi:MULTISPECIES: hypothetical protein [Comamonas]|uniref:hypothetical protein n=1 Tax=Comamonas TaxID=283 RepID=UPI000AE69E77|nr:MULTISPECIES: hypothetical protein [Comamonas]
MLLTNKSDTFSSIFAYLHLGFVAKRLLWALVISQSRKPVQVFFQALIAVGVM